MARLIEGKAEIESMKTLSNSPVKQYIGKGIERMSLITKSNVKMKLMDQTRIVVPISLREVLLMREHRSHSGQTKMDNSIRVKYF